MMSIDTTGIALEAHLNHEPTVIANALRAARAVDRVGFCLEHYQALEQLQPGIFKDINPKMLTQQPSAVKRSVAVEAISGSDMVKALGVGIAAGSAVALFFKLIEWIADKLSGGKGGGIPTPEQIERENKAAFQKIAETDRKNREAFKAVFNDLDSSLDKLAKRQKNTGKILDELEKNIRAASSPIELMCVEAVMKACPDEMMYQAKAVGAMRLYKGGDILRYNLCLKNGVRGILAVFEEPALKNVDFSKLQRVAKDLADALQTADNFISRQTDGSLDMLVKQAKKVAEEFEKMDIPQSAKAEINTRATKVYSFHTSAADFAKEHERPEKGNLDKLDLSSPRYTSIIKDSYVCQNIVKDAAGKVKGKSDAKIDSKEHAAKFKSAIGDLQRVITGLLYFTNLSDKMNKAFTLALERYMKAEITI